MSVNDCKIINFQNIVTNRGSLTWIERSNNLPFDIKRVFYIYDVPTGQSRGSHAHKNLEEILICLSGSFEVDLDNGIEKISYHLNRPWNGLHIKPMTWFSLKNFGTGTVCLVLCSNKYDENDYIRNYNNYLKLLNKQHSLVKK